MRLENRFHQLPRGQHKSWFENALSGLSQASSKKGIGHQFYSVSSAEGFRNLVLVKVREGTIVEVDWSRLPAGFIDHYLAQYWAECDPVLKYARTARTMFAWQDLLASPGLTPAERAMMEAAAALGVHSGHTIPFHSPDRTTTLISISQRERRVPVDADRIRLLRVLALFCLSRLAELETKAATSGPDAAAPSPLPRPLSPIEGGADTAFTLTHPHLRELVLIEVGVRRWQMGLTGLGTRIFKSRNKPEIADLERWGLVVEMPDDERWCFHLAPSVLGWSYLRNRPEVEWMRRQIWEHEIDRNEMPDTAGIS